MFEGDPGDRIRIQTRGHRARGGRAGGVASSVTAWPACSELESCAALRRSAYVLAGGLLQAMLAVAVWPFRPALPERTAAATACDALAGVAGEWPGPPQSSAFISAAAKVESMLAAHRTWGARRTEV